MKIVETAAETLLAISFMIRCGDSDDRSGAALVAKLRRRTEAIEQGHVEVHQDRVDRISIDLRLVHAVDRLVSVRGKDRPFMMFCQFKAPHDTWQCAPRYEKLCADVKLPEPATLFDDYTTRSAALKKTLQFIGSRWGHHTDLVRQTKGLEGRARKKAQYQLYM